MKNFLIIVNPGKGLHKITERVCATIEGKGHTSQVLSQLDRSSLDGYSDIILIGGDGTLNYIINQLPTFELPIGIIPAGSGNDYVKALNIGSNLVQQIEIAIDGTAISVDLGSCNEKLFLNGFGLGFDGQIAKSFEENRTILRGHAAYYYHVVKTLAGFQPRPLKFSIDGKEFDDKVLLLTIGKGTTFGGGFKLTPHADLEDGQFAISIIRDLKPLKRFLNIHRLQQGSHDNLEEVQFLKGKHITIEPQPNLTAHIDGELIGSPPFGIRVLPGKLRIKVCPI